MAKGEGREGGVRRRVQRLCESRGPWWHGEGVGEIKGKGIVYCSKVVQGSEGGGIEGKRGEEGSRGMMMEEERKAPRSKQGGAATACCMSTGL